MPTSPELTAKQQWLTRRYIAYKVLSDLWFVGAVWVYYYRIFITDREIGILDGVAFAIGLIAEVPSGALADKFGRDKIVRLGQILVGVGITLPIFGSELWHFMLAQTILMIGHSFISGADEALFFQQLGFEQKSGKWRKLVTRGFQIALTGSLIASVVGGWMHNIDPRLPWLLSGLAFFAAAVAVWPVQDIRVKRTSVSFSEEIWHYLNDIHSGFRQFREKNLSPYLPMIVIVQGLIYMAGWGLLRIVLLDRFHFSPFAGSIVIAISGLSTIIILTLLHRYAESVGEKFILTTISIGSVIVLVSSVFDIGHYGILVIVFLYASEYVMHPFMSEIINYHSPEDQRATVLSVASFLRTLPYVILAPLIGYLNSRGNLHYFLIVWAGLICLVLVVYLSRIRKSARIKLTEDVA